MLNQNYIIDHLFSLIKKKKNKERKIRSVLVSQCEYMIDFSEFFFAVKVVINWRLNSQAKIVHRGPSLMLLLIFRCFCNYL